MPTYIKPSYEWKLLSISFVNKSELSSLRFFRCVLAWGRGREGKKFVGVGSDSFFTRLFSVQLQRLQLFLKQHPVPEPRKTRPKLCRSVTEIFLCNWRKRASLGRACQVPAQGLALRTGLWISQHRLLLLTISQTFARGPFWTLPPGAKLSQGWTLSPRARGEVIPWGRNSLFAPPFF
jgi:hypothetical protein